MRPRVRRKTIVISVIWLGAGFAINLLVTAFLALYSPQLLYERSIDPAPSWWVHAPADAPPPQVQLVDRTIGQTRFTVQAIDAFDDASVADYVERSRLATYLTDYSDHTAMGRRVGFPMRAFAEHWSTFGVVRRGNPASLWDRIVWAHERGVPTNFGRSPSLPVRPLWFGLIVNTIAYALIAWGLIRGPFVMRRRRRVRRGWCLACGFDASGLDVCPECGEACRTLPA